MSLANQEKIWARAEVIIAVRSGKMSATAGSKVLGISRQRFYTLEKKALGALMESLTGKTPGRPRQSRDPEKESLQEEVKSLQKRLVLAEKTVEVKNLLSAYDRQLEKEEKLSPRNSGGLKKRSGRKKRK